MGGFMAVCVTDFVQGTLMLIGLLIVETIGGLQWHFVGGSMSIPAIAVYSLTAFIPKDIVITVLAVLIAIPIRKGINNAGNR